MKAGRLFHSKKHIVSRGFSEKPEGKMFDGLEVQMHTDRPMASRN